MSTTYSDGTIEMCATCHKPQGELLCERERCGAPICSPCWTSSPYGAAWEAEVKALGKYPDPERPVLCRACCS